MGKKDDPRRSKHERPREYLDKFEVLNACFVVSFWANLYFKLGQISSGDLGLLSLA